MPVRRSENPFSLKEIVFLLAPLVKMQAMKKVALSISSIGLVRVGTKPQSCARATRRGKTSLDQRLSSMATLHFLLLEAMETMADRRGQLAYSFETATVNGFISKR
jgi:hypothetical protein